MQTTYTVDEVVGVVTSEYSSFFGKVIKVTPSGQVVVEQENDMSEAKQLYRFDKDGDLMGSRSTYHRPRLVKAAVLQERLARRDLQQQTDRKVTELKKAIEEIFRNHCNGYGNTCPESFETAKTKLKALVNAL